MVYTRLPYNNAYGWNRSNVKAQRSLFTFIICSVFNRQIYSWHPPIWWWPTKALLTVAYIHNLSHIHYIYWQVFTLDQPVHIEGNMSSLPYTTWACAWRRTIPIQTISRQIIKLIQFNSAMSCKHKPSLTHELVLMELITGAVYTITREIIISARRWISFNSQF